MNIEINSLENKRQLLQVDLDNLKTKKERNRLGQFSTPLALTNDILNYTSSLIPKNKKIRFLDPAIGTGVFFSALSQHFSLERIEIAKGFEIDKHYGIPSKNLWISTTLEYTIDNFTRVPPPKNENNKYNLVICNPPYVRHHYITEEKERLKELSKKSANVNLSSLSGLYCYFIALAHSWMKNGAIGVWLVPSEFMDVNYGSAIKEYLLKEVTLLRVHRFEPANTQFEDALVSSSIVWIKNKKTTNNYNVQFTYGGTIELPTCKKKIPIDILKVEKKWTRFPLLNKRIETNKPRLSDFFSIKRGIATGDNSFFILSKDEIEQKELPIEEFKPILPSPRYIKEIEILADIEGNPKINHQLFVLNCSLDINKIKFKYPKLYKYLEEGIQQGVADRYLCKNRKVWYIQEKREESFFYCTYMGRSSSNKKAFRFILNHSKAIVSNSYLILYIKPEFKPIFDNNIKIRNKTLEVLNKITNSSMIEEGRVYGGGLHKLEPKELANVLAVDLANLLYTSLSSNITVKKIA
jgi:hypothetical protein